MVGINSSILVGRITADPEVRYTQSGLPVCSFSLAVDRRYKDLAGNSKTDFIRCVAWRKLAELMNQYVKKGYLLGIQGELHQEKYSKDGEERTTYQVVVNELQFLDRGGKGGEGAASASGGGQAAGAASGGGNPDDDLPF